MIAYPTVTITNKASNDAGIPFFRKSDAPINLWPSLFSCVILDCQLCQFQKHQMTYAVIFGNPETGSPIPAEQINAVAFKSAFLRCNAVQCTDHDEQLWVRFAERVTDPLCDRY